MQKQFPVYFPVDFATGEPGFIPIGRMYFGGHLARLYFSPKGYTVMTIDEAALKDGSIVFTKKAGDEIRVVGFGPKPEQPKSDPPKAA
jgi:hypothetical protein